MKDVLHRMRAQRLDDMTYHLGLAIRYSAIAADRIRNGIDAEAYTELMSMTMNQINGCYSGWLEDEKRRLEEQLAQERADAARKALQYMADHPLEMPPNPVDNPPAPYDRLKMRPIIEEEDTRDLPF